MTTTNPLTVTLMPENTNPSQPAADAVVAWIEQCEALLAQTQAALESLRFHSGVAPDAQRTLYQLLVVVRQRRAQTPTPEAVRVWVRALPGEDIGRMKGPAKFLNARGADAPPPPAPLPDA